MGSPVTSDFTWGYHTKSLVYFCFSHLVIPRIKMFFPLSTVVSLRNPNLRALSQMRAPCFSFCCFSLFWISHLASVSFCSATQAAAGTPRPSAPSYPLLAAAAEPSLREVAAVAQKRRSGLCCWVGLSWCLTRGIKHFGPFFP